MRTLQFIKKMAAVIFGIVIVWLAVVAVTIAIGLLIRIVIWAATG